MKKSQSSELLMQFLVVIGFVALLVVASLVQAAASPAPAVTPTSPAAPTKSPEQGTVVATTAPSTATSTLAPSATAVGTKALTPTSTEKPTSTTAPTHTPKPQPSQTPTRTPEPINTTNPEPITPPANTPNPIVNIVWEWTSVTTQSNWQTTTIQNPENYTITFRADGSLIGKADCNVFSGVYSQTSGFTIQLGPMTMAYCGEGSLDRQFLELLSNVAAGGPDGQSNLALETAGGAQRMLFTNGGPAQ